MMCRLGPLTLLKGIGFPIFSQISLILVDLHLFLPIFFHFCVLCTPTLAVFILRASLMTPNFFSFYLSGCLWHPSDVTTLNRQWLQDATTTKIGSLTKTFLLDPSLVIRFSSSEISSLPGALRFMFSLACLIIRMLTIVCLYIFFYNSLLWGLELRG